ncbi:Putative alpha-1,3-mannosyltransferase MNN14 [Cytospora mali]|uniref:Alpha-1,3-mannosyltransferase MNN14 n=1 Tax=Cytospora mali TaxID=578113 RepID=A0A194WBG7_CYTMA|nr:Putative alpha-1,3-mannosyltransferase MNN14 [Valsa mali]
MPGVGDMFVPAGSPLKEGRTWLPADGLSRRALRTRQVIAAACLLLFIRAVHFMYSEPSEHEYVRLSHGAAHKLGHNTRPEETHAVTTGETPKGSFNTAPPVILPPNSGQKPINGQEDIKSNMGSKQTALGQGKKTESHAPRPGFDEALRRITNLLPGELEIRGLLQPITVTGERRLREFAIRSRKYKKYLEAWEDLHLVPDPEGGTYIRDDVIQYIHDQHRTTNSADGHNELAEAVHAYEGYRELLVQLSQLLFPYTAPYFPDHMTLHSHLQKGGRGIVLTAGNDQVAYLLTQIPVLRRLGCNLPIEVMYVGDEDMNRDSRQDLEELEGVVTRDVGVMIHAEGWQVASWAAKPFAILLSSFREAIFIDADSFFFKNPEVLFDDPGYVKTGALFFRDRLIMPENKREWLQSILPQPVSRNVKQSRLWVGDSGHQQESGVIVVDKYRHFMALLFTTRMNGPDRDGKQDEGIVGVYDMVYGDKETFWLSWELVGDTGYVFHQGDAGTLGVIQAHADIQYDQPELPPWATPDNTTEAGIESQASGALPSQRMCAPQLLHLDVDNTPLWFNGGLVMNKFLDRREWKFESFASYLIEPRDVREPGAWVLGEGNMCCLTTDNHLRGDLTVAEKELLNEMIKQAKKVGIAP